jgi:Zn-dependent protease
VPDLSTIAHTASIWVLPVLFAITLHEAAHAWVAWRLGDPTAKMLGRVSFNPLKHVDVFGTVLLPASLVFLGSPFLFGWAKPVPVDMRQFYHPRRDMALVAAAGPATNLFLAWASAMAAHLLFLLPADVAVWLAQNLENSVHLNLILAVLNMLPLPPLDGGRVAVGILPDFLAYPLARMERFGLFILIGLLFIVPMVTRQLDLDFNLVGNVIGKPVAWLHNLLIDITGH